MVEKPTETNDSLMRPAADSAEGEVASRARSADASSTSYSSYLFGRAGEEGKPLWSDSTHGRAMIRLVSRGIVGSLAMTVVDRVSRNQLMNYTPESIKGLGGWWQANTSAKIAKGYDTVFGKPIQMFVKAISPAGRTEAGMLIKDAYAKNATTFRFKSYYHTTPGHFPGHSLGAEIVQVTASFAAASFGDAATRNIIQVFDPNSVKSWMVNDKGDIAKADETKHFDAAKWAKATLRTTWRVASKNMGEDWAVALPYIYQMRWQRGIIAKQFPNSKLVLDNGLNGGSMLVDRKGEIVGDFQLPGAIDLHTRFVGYNWYTLMYRETYDAVGRQFGKWADSGYSLKPHLPSNPIAAAVDTLGYGARYVAKSFIKANLYMNPAVVPFWMVRVPQSKWRSPAIVTGCAAGQNGFAQLGPNPDRQYMRDEVGRLRSTYNSMDSRHTYIQTTNKGPMYVDGHYDKPISTQKLRGDKVYSWDMAKDLMKANPVSGAFSAMLMPFGWMSYQAGGLATKLANKLPTDGRLSRMISTSNGVTSAANREGFMRSFVDNSAAYTPYMIAKAETALRVDERPADGGLGAEDKAIYKFIDSTVRFDLKNAGKAIKEIAANAVDMGREVKMREGGEVTAGATKQKTPMAPEDKPMGRVHAKTIQRAADARVPAGDKAANDEEYSPKAANDEQYHKHWSESVAGNAGDGRVYAGSRSIH